MDESPRERAISSEPCSGRPNPFDDVTEQTSRKRQRVSRGESRSRSVDTARDSDTLPDAMSPLQRGIDKAEPEPILPSTPTRTTSEPPPAEPTSSRVTINLRTNRTLESIPSSPPSPTSPSKMPNGGEDNTARLSVESESDALSTIPAIETPSSSPSAASSPQVELVNMDDDDSDQDPTVELIDDDDGYVDFMLTFPYREPGETALMASKRINQFFQNEDVNSSEAFCKIRDWIIYCLAATNPLDTLYDMLVKNREFWKSFADMIWALSHRSRFFGNFLRSGQEARQSLSDMFVQFARLAGKFVELDVRTFSSYAQNGNSQEPILGSREFLYAYDHLLRKDQLSHIGKNLENHYQWSWDEDIDAMEEAFHVAGGTIPNLTSLVQGELGLISRNPKIIETFSNPCRIVSKTVLDIVPILDRRDPQHQQSVNAAAEKVSQGYEFFQVSSKGLRTIIEKHVTFLTVDNAMAHITALSELFKCALRYETDSVQELLEASRRKYADLSRKQFPDVLSIEWKFSIFTKLITSSQMQLRVTGVSQMCTDLLALHSQNKHYSVPECPILLFFARFVLENQLVNYLVGTGSHPEIISESTNILGFLIVTKTWTPQLTDKVWQTIMTSQDPRVVEATVMMMKKSLNLFDYPPLLYLCKRVSDVPVESFTGGFRDFCYWLFKNLVDRASNEGIRPLDTPPYDLCVRLIRESSVITAASPLGHPELQTFAAGKFRELLQHGPGEDARSDIYISCIADISSKSPTSAGSICVINALLSSNSGPDLKKLTIEHGLTKLLVEELESVAENERSSNFQTRCSAAASSARRELVDLIITYEPRTISDDLGERLWDVLVGSKSNVSSGRNTSWQLLNNVAKSTSGKNPFIVSCFRDYLPKLPPHCFTNGSLDFVREAISCWYDGVQEDFVAENRTFNSPALEQLWRMILTAPPNTIDALAINILVDVYVSSPLILGIPRAIARSIHSTLVDRCLEQLKGAASKLKVFSDDASNGSDEAMVIVATDDQFHEQEMIFARSLAVLREFLRAYQSKPQFAPPKSRLSITTAPSAAEGEPLTVKYQSFDGNKQTDVMSLKLGTLNTAATLFASLEQATGFKSYKVYCGGKEVDPDEIDVCKSLEDLNFNGLVLVRRREDNDGLSDRPAGSKATLELEIAKHFDDLWSYLSMNEKVAQEIYYFLIKFDLYDRMLQNFESNTPHTEIFPVGYPFKSLYAVHSLRKYIATQSQKGSVNEAALTRAISLIVAAISDPNVISQCGNDDLKDVLALHMMDCLLHFLKEPILPTSVAPYLNRSLLERLLELIYATKKAQISQNSIHLTARLFEAILEASIHHVAFWDLFVLHLQSSSLLKDLVLVDPHPFIRKNAIKQIVNKCAFVPSLAQVSSTQFVVAFWPMVVQLIPEAVLMPLQCEETFALSLTLFKRFAEVAMRDLNLENLVKQWGNLLLSHRCVESVGHPESIDPVAQGLTTMVFYATSFTKASQRTLSCSKLGTNLFHQHLFPELSIGEDDKELIPRIPLLNPTTRRTMSDTIYFLVKDDEEQYKALLIQLSQLVPHSAEDGPYIYDLSFQFERSRSIRSQTGYVGLRNLSNTCYLNSLFTQLFMNIPFREFMLKSHVADGGVSQKLLFETQNLFSYMQNSLRRFVDPVSLAGSIRTYEETPIDISIQMDVDEFYNLLFDRWESQILSPEAKRTFRSFYGGQLVTQIKSKECPHISERLESFSAIQCDIKGKNSLEESLQAYVEGEVMEGDNKYKCSTCDRHVDAVKRACLKDIPDSLIFHLKRFDFNLRTLMRSKINDHFTFPKTIDMRPYKVDYLMNSSEEIPEDVFELVGILVHSGTAESGHYYSFIRERPCTGGRESWVEFNDECVSPWDPNRMESACFGGPDYHGHIDNNNNPYDKTWSAYMLFYQRSSVLTSQMQEMELARLSSPVRLPLPLRLSNHIAMENELLMRKYCLYDPSHATFVSKMLANIKNVNGGSCSTAHVMEKLALTVALHHLDQVFARTKDTPDFVNFMLSVRQFCQSCAECSRDYLEWYCDHPETMKQLLLRNPDGLLRHEIAMSIITALNKVKVDASYAYGFGDDEDSADELEGGDPQLIQRVVKCINRLWDFFHFNCRAWPEYFGLLASIAQMGKREATLLLDAGFLRKSLEVVSADAALPLGPQYSKLLNILSKRLANRPVSYDAVITLLYQLMSVCDPSLDPIADEDERLDLALSDRRIPLTSTERHLLMQHWTRNRSHILLEKLLLLRQNPETTKNIMIKLMDWPETLDPYIYQTILLGLKRGSSTMLCGPFIRAAATYCEESKEPKAVTNMVMRISKLAEELDNGEGGAILQFFKDIFDPAVRDDNMSAEDFLKFFFEEMNIWGPVLLTDYDSNVRADTEDFIRLSLLVHGPDVNFGEEEEDIEKATIMVHAAQQLGIACLEYCQETYLRQRQQAVKAVVSNIQEVIETCHTFFDFSNKDVTTRRFYDLCTSVLVPLRKCTVDEADEEVSDWEGSDGEYDDGSSEPIGALNDDEILQ